jgi:hypothetical protein
MIQVSEEDSDVACFTKAKKRGEQTFTLVQQDKSSAKTICFWIMENIETAPKHKLLEALDDAIKFRDFNPNRKKFAD